MRRKPALQLLKNTWFIALCLAGIAACQDAEDDMAHEGPAMNFHRVDAQLATGGHFADDGIAALAEQGVTFVVDLRDEPPEGLEERLAASGIRYSNVPVVWKSPRREDYEAFSQVMAENEDEHVFVQCQANYRASAMTYLYRVAGQGVPEAEARKDLNVIWEPEGTWAEYIDDVLAASGSQ